MKKELIVFLAHIDDFECACYGYVFKHHKEYDKIKIITATTWAKKVSVWEENLKLFPKEILNKIEDINLGFAQRKLNTDFDDLKDKDKNRFLSYLIPREVLIKCDNITDEEHESYIHETFER